MKIALTLGAAACLCVTVGAAYAQQQMIGEIERADLPGRQVFEHQCAPCHGTGPGDDGSPTLPGTAALDAKYEGRLPGQLELRSDLSAPVLSLFVRRGSGAMPMFRKGELTDEQIAQIAEYLSATAALNQR